jgi:hypothetical protein
LLDRHTACGYDRNWDFRGLPERGDCQLLMPMPPPDDFIAFARRGLFAYDWQDSHRTADRSGGYELVSRPDIPALVEELSSVVASLARRVCLAAMRFADSRRVAVVEYVECAPADPGAAAPSSSARR